MACQGYWPCSGGFYDPAPPATDVANNPSVEVDTCVLKEFNCDGSLFDPDAGVSGEASSEHLLCWRARL